MRIEITAKVLDSMLDKFLADFGKFCGLNIMADQNDLKFVKADSKFGCWYTVRLSIEIDEKPTKHL